MGEVTLCSSAPLRNPPRICETRRQRSSQAQEEARFEQDRAILIGDPLGGAAEVGVPAAEFRVIDLDPVDNRGRGEVRIADAEQMYAARARVSSAHDPIPWQRSLDTGVELQGIRILQIVIEGLHLVQNVVWVEARQEIRERRSYDRTALCEGGFVLPEKT